MNIKIYLEQLCKREGLTETQMITIMTAIMNGELEDIQVAALLTALSVKGESSEELIAGAKVMRQFALPVPIKTNNLVDIVGTGGDNSQTFNISTAAAFVVAASGALVAKHGNRSVSSRSGSADVLEALGVNINLDAKKVAACVNQIGIGFMFAPTHHTAMKHIRHVRKALEIRTIFNLLGPLTNPANAKKQLIGVYDAKWLIPFANALKNLGSQHALIVHSEDGLDEISIAAPTQVTELHAGLITQYKITPEQFSIHKGDLSSLRVSNVAESVAILKAVLNNEDSAARNIVILNAGAALYVAGMTDNLAAGIKKAAHILASGLALEKLKQLIKFSNQ